MSKSVAVALCLPCLLTGCSTAPRPRPQVDNAKHTISVRGPLTEDEAARIALLNNAGFLEVAEDNGISQAQLLQATQLPNPTLSVLFPLGPKQLEFAAKYPLEALWLRPRKIAAAQLDAAKVEKQVSQSGLDLVRDVKLACVDLRFADRQAVLANQTADLLEEIAKLAETRLRAGDISELDVEVVRNEALTARSAATGLPLQTAAAREKLRHLLGQSIHSGALTLRSASPLPASLPPERALLKQALATRPDLRAAEIAIEAAGERAHLAESEIITLTGILDANGNPFEAGPGVDLSLPVLNRNEGGKALATAQLRKATRHYATVRDAIAAEVRQARLGYLQAQQVVASVRDDLLPTLETAVVNSRRAFDAGNLSWLTVLESSRRLHDARIRHATALADAQRAAAHLEHGLGSSLSLLR